MQPRLLSVMLFFSITSSRGNLAGVNLNCVKELEHASGKCNFSSALAEMYSENDLAIVLNIMMKFHKKKLMILKCKNVIRKFRIPI